MVTEEERRRIEEWYMEMAEHDRAQMIADAREEGMQQGMQQGLVNAVLGLMNNLHIDEAKAMDMLGISEEDRIEIVKHIGKV